MRRQPSVRRIPYRFDREYVSRSPSSRPRSTVPISERAFVSSAQKVTPSAERTTSRNNVGPLAMARALEAMAILNIALQIQHGWPWQSAFKLVGPGPDGKRA